MRDLELQRWGRSLTVGRLVCDSFLAAAKLVLGFHHGLSERVETSYFGQVACDAWSAKEFRDSREVRSALPDEILERRHVGLHDLFKSLEIVTLAPGLKQVI
jgi:hypothetical protein